MFILCWMGTVHREYKFTIFFIALTLSPFELLHGNWPTWSKVQIFSNQINVRIQMNKKHECPLPTLAAFFAATNCSLPNTFDLLPCETIMITRRMIYMNMQEGKIRSHADDDGGGGEKNGSGKSSSKGRKKIMHMWMKLHNWLQQYNWMKLHSQISHVERYTHTSDGVIPMLWHIHEKSSQPVAVILIFISFMRTWICTAPATIHNTKHEMITMWPKTTHNNGTNDNNNKKREKRYIIVNSWIKIVHHTAQHRDPLLIKWNEGWSRKCVSVYMHRCIELKRRRTRVYIIYVAYKMRYMSCSNKKLSETNLPH